jgi:hypothetical protein
MKKLVLISLLGIFAVSLVIAGYVYNNFVIQADVYEPFTVQYAILGVGSNWDGTTCEQYQGEWTTYTNGQTIDMQGLFAGESRLACAKITNAGEAQVDYTFSYSITDNEGNHDACVNAFGENSISGTAIALGDTITTGMPIVVADGATPVQDCFITILASRG